MKSHAITVAQMILLASLGIANPSPVQAQKQLADANFYIKKEITAGAGIVNLIDSSTAYKVGTSSFDKQRLPAGTNMVLDRIRLSVAVVANTDTNSPAAQSYSNKYSSFPAKLRAAHFIITRGGSKVLEIPIAHFLTTDGVQGTIGIDDVYDLQALRQLNDKEELEIQLSFPDNVAWADNTTKVFVSVELLGPKVLVS